jgi:hypothetical protein
MLSFFHQKIPILDGGFADRIWDLTTFLMLVKTSDNWFAIFYKWIIFWTSNSHWFVFGSKWDKFELFQVISCHASRNNFSFPNDEKMFSSKWQSSKRVLKTSPVKGLKNLIIYGESKPT